MKKLLPVVIALILLIVANVLVVAQDRVYNPNLPNHLVFQWRFAASQVNPSWANESFSTVRTSEGLQVYFGVYDNLESALAAAEQVQLYSKGAVELVPFFNQRSIATEDAMALLGNLNAVDQGLAELSSEVVSYTVYFGTYDRLLSDSEIEGIDGTLSFEVNSDYTFSYAWGDFAAREDAEEAVLRMQALGFEEAAVNHYLNGERVAMAEMNEIYAYLNYACLDETIY